MKENLKNYNKLSLIILCAGEGKRIQKFFPKIPKSLIKIKNLDKSIVEYTITQFLNLNFNKIYLIYGYKANIFIKYIKDLESKNKIDNFHLNNSIFPVNAEKNYQKGPFHSFLEILNEPNFIIDDNFFLLIPGDTIFENELLNSILGYIKEKIGKKINMPIIFYREFDKNLKEIYKSKKCFSISVVNILKEKNNEFLKSIEQIDIKSNKLEKSIFQVIPIYFFPSKFLEEIRDSIDINLDDYSNLTEFINSVYLKENQVLTHEINKSLNFFEVDTIEDLQFLEANYKVN